MAALWSYHERTLSQVGVNLDMDLDAASSQNAIKQNAKNMLKLSDQIF